MYPNNTTTTDEGKHIDVFPNVFAIVLFKKEERNRKVNNHHLKLLTKFFKNSYDHESR